MTQPRYGRDDYIACLAFAGPPPRWDIGNHGFGQTVASAKHSAALARRVDYIDLIEEFCEHWFAGKPIDGQWANFFTNFDKWYRQENRNVKTHRMARDHPMFDISRT